MIYDAVKRLADRAPLILASRSPRRRELLSQIGVTFQQIISDIDEQRHSGETPTAYAERLAREKAVAVRHRTGDGSVVIGSDTVVILGDGLLDKPADVEEAFSHLTQLSGRQHVVCTALALCGPGDTMFSGIETTRVFFNEVTPEQIREYLTSGEPMDKAGAYGIQGMGAFLVDRIEGNLDTVVGLPCTLLDKLARKLLRDMQ